MEKDSKIYVAGHLGLVGSALWKTLQNKGYSNLIGKSIDELNLMDNHAVSAFFEKEKPEYVILAAAKVGGIVANNTYRGQFIYENLTIQNNVIHNAYVYGVKKLLFLGSTCIYPGNAPQPMPEDCLLTSPLEYTNEPYAIAKIAGIKMCESYNLQYGTNFISVMPTNLYGPNDNFNLETSHVLPALIRKIHLGKCLEENNWDTIRADLNKRPIEGINGEGAIERQGEEETRRQGEGAIERQGEGETRRQGEGEIERQGEEATRRQGEGAIERQGEGETRRQGGDALEEEVKKKEILSILNKYGIRITQSPGHPLAQSPTRPFTQSPSHPLAQSPSRPVAQSPSRPIAQSPSRPIVSVELWGTGAPFREFLWSEEMAAACVFCMENVDFQDVIANGVKQSHKEQIATLPPVIRNDASIRDNSHEIRNTHINIGTGKEITIKDLAYLIKSRLGFNGEIVFDTSKPDGTMRKLTDPSKIHALGWQHQIEIEEGIGKLYDWYLSQI